MKRARPERRLRPQSELVAAGRQYSEHGAVNPAVYRASTITFPDLATLLSGEQEYVYGRKGTPTSRAFEAAVAALEGGHNSRAAPSGLMAITMALLAFLKAGDHLLMVDTVYNPVRRVCEDVCARLGVETTYFDPALAAGIDALIRPNTRVIYCESPGSLTMEVQDVPAIFDAARRRHVVCMIDNTWSGGHFFKPFDHGADVSIQAATKYIVGHSDAMLGVVTCNAETWPGFNEACTTMGLFAGPDDMFLGLRGLRTLGVRLERHMENGIQLAEWLQGRPEVEVVLHPALSSNAGHSLWRRDFTGASGLFSAVLKPVRREGLAAFLDGLELFAMGASWGGYESLILPFKAARRHGEWAPGARCLRLHAGLEHVEDLLADLADGFERLRAAA